MPTETQSEQEKSEVQCALGALVRALARAAAREMAASLLVHQETKEPDHE